MQEINKENYKVIDIDNNNKILLHVPSMNLIYQSGENINYDKINSMMSNYLDVDKNIKIKNYKSIDHLSGLILNTTESCNLACNYCMVSKGTYNNDNFKKSMELNDYCKIFNYVFKKYKNGTSFVCFFGGEPLIRFKVIKEAIKVLFGMYEVRGLKRPRCSIISNGVLLNDEVVDFLNKYHIYLSLSIDGIDELHDAARVFPDGSGSYHIIEKNLQKIKKIKREFPLYCESTIHKKHLDMCQGNERRSGYEFVRKLYQLGFDSVYVFPVDSKDKEISLDNPEYYEKMKLFYSGIYDYYMEICLSDNITTLPPGHFVGVFGNIFMKRANRFCKAGIGTLFVNPQGELYPCHLLYQSKNLKLGNLEDEYKLSTDKRGKLIGNRYKVAKCKICSNRNLCFLWCPGSSMLNNGKILSTINTRCVLVDITVKYIIKEIGKLLINPAKYNLFKRNITKIAHYYKANYFTED